MDQAGTLNCNKGQQGGILFDVTHSLRGEGFDASEDGTGRGTPLVPASYGIAGNTIGRKPENGGNGLGFDEELSYTLTKTDRHGVAQPIAFSAKDYGGDATADLSPTLRAMPHDGSHANGGGQMAVAQPISFGAQMSVPQVDFDLNQTLQAKNPMAVAQPVNIYGGNKRPDRPEGGFYVRMDENTSKTLDAASGLNPTCSQGGTAVMQSMAVRRLTPVECERLQGFPDNYTDVPWRGKGYAPDGPRYKALGNSWAVPVVRWIGQRIHNAVFTGKPVCN
jgi:DNA (cytosine-5)-methyltransferase 1